MKSSAVVGITFIAFTSSPQPVGAQRLKPIPHAVGAPQSAARTEAGASQKGNPSPWTPLTNQPNFLLDGAANPILLTDGSVLVQDAGFPDWWKLTPDQNGNYINGTWTQVASLPATYSPLYHSSAVLPDGRLIIEGGEYLLNLAQTQFVPTWTPQGSIYDPIADTWTPVAPPSFFSGFGKHPQTIGDAQGVVLSNGTYMQANCCTTEQALLDAKTLTWSPTGSNKFDINDEEGWTLLPNKKVLTVDAYVIPYELNGTNSEIYDPGTGSWSSAGSTIVQIWDSAATCGGFNASSSEVGPAVLRPDGTVFYTGANSCQVSAGPPAVFASANTAIYDSRKGKWEEGPTFPSGLGIADGPAALEPNGNVLMMTSPGFGNSPSVFFEWDGHELEQVPGTPNAPGDSSFFGNMLVLPTGQILLTDFSNDIEIYTPTPGYRPTWAPVVLNCPFVVKRGASYQISGLRFNGMSQGAAYGDDAQAATNYPLVRITNLETGHVFYSRTHDHSSMAVASDDVVSTHFDVPAVQEPGLSKLEVVANGIPSEPSYVYVKEGERDQ
jgi:hypothetical protein